MSDLTNGEAAVGQVNAPESSSQENITVSHVECKQNAQTSDKSPPNKSKISLNSFTNLALNFRRTNGVPILEASTTRNVHASHSKDNLLEITNELPPGTKKRSKWIMKFNCAKLKCMKSPLLNDNARSRIKNKSCVCTCYRKNHMVEDAIGGSAGIQSSAAPSVLVENGEGSNTSLSGGDIASASECAAAANEPIEGLLSEEEQSTELASETNTPPEPVYRTVDCADNSEGNIIRQDSLNSMESVRNDNEKWIQIIYPPEHPEDLDDEEDQYQANNVIIRQANNSNSFMAQHICGRTLSSYGAKKCLQLICPADISMESLRALFQSHFQVDSVSKCHTQIDYIHYLVPDLQQITLCSFYWGKMDRYEAERLLDGKPEGTFLLRDSAQDEFLFSVSFRKYGRSLHARIEQWNHKFSFDSHDPGVYASDTVCGLIEHYKDPTCCMFFEPILTLPLHRNFTFSLQHLCRSIITSRLQYDTVDFLQLPNVLKVYLKEYHYRQKVRLKRFDIGEVQCVDFNRS